MNHKLIAETLADTFINGNRSDFVQALREMPPLDAALIALDLAKLDPSEMNDIYKAIKARL